MRKLYAFYWDCHRMGSLDGLFVATDEDIQRILGKKIYFGEVLGKHSEIYGTIEEGDLTVKGDDQDFIDKLVKIIGGTTISGYNPVSYYYSGLENCQYDAELTDICEAHECDKYKEDHSGEGKSPWNCKQWLRKDGYSDCPKVLEILKFMDRPEE